MALCVPSDRADETGGASTSAVAAADDRVEGDYRWTREFAYNPQRDADGAHAFGFTLTGDAAYYVPIRAGFQLGKRKRQEFVDVAVPEKVRGCAPILCHC